MAARYPRSLDSIVTFIQGDRIRRCPSDERQMKCTPFAKLSAFSIQDRHFIRRSPWNLEYAPRCLQIYFEGKIRLSKKRPAFSPLFTAKATFALKAVAWRRRGCLVNHLSKLSFRIHRVDERYLTRIGEQVQTRLKPHVGSPHRLHRRTRLPKQKYRFETAALMGRP